MVKNNAEESYYYYEFNLQGDIIGIINSAERSGGEGGKYVAPVNTVPTKLSLPPDKINAPITNYVVLKPIPVQAGTAMPWYGQPGGGTQFLLPDTIYNLRHEGYLGVYPN